VESKKKFPLPAAVTAVTMRCLALFAALLLLACASPTQAALDAASPDSPANLSAAADQLSPSLFPSP